MQMPSIIKLITFLLYSLTIILFSETNILYSQENDSSKNHPKVKIVLCKYQGANVQHTSGFKFDVFRGIIDRKIINLRREILDEFSNKPNERIKMLYLKDIHIDYKKKDTFKTPDAAYKWMQNQKNVLSLMKGSINSDDNIAYKAHSEIYIDDLNKYFPYDMITVTLLINDSEFINKLDSHTLAILFALAVDGKNFGLEKPKIAVFLKKANDKLSDFERRSRKKVSEDLFYLKQSIEKLGEEIIPKKNSEETNKVNDENSTKDISN